MSGHRVMVVTENAAFRKILSGLVQASGFEAFAAADSIDALRQIYHVAPQVIVSDASLTNYAGFDLLSFVRRRFPEIGIMTVLTERWREAESSNVAVADATLSVHPFNPGLFSDSLAGLMAKYPVSRNDGANRGAEPSSPGSSRSRADGGACKRCDELQQNASRARMHSLLARAWHRLHPDSDEAAGLDTDAGFTLRRAQSELAHHRGQVHGYLGRSESQTSPVEPSEFPPRCAAN
jgi:CheY-like chemotaxis protein